MEADFCQPCNSPQPSIFADSFFKIAEMKNKGFKHLMLLSGLTLVLGSAFAQNKKRTTAEQVGKKGEFYISWGYNKEWYTSSNLHISQPSLGNDYKFANVLANDHPGWDHGITNKAISIPQYNYRVGYFFKDNWGFEINFDHTKYIVTTNQLLHVKGTKDGKQVDEFYENNKPYGNAQQPLTYFLNNGANFLLFNLVHRKHLTSFNTNWFDASVLLKGGVGIVIPHVENTIFGESNDPHFQVGGMDVGVEAALRMTFAKYVFLEYCNKLVYANYWGLRIKDGTARQAFGCYEMILNLGVSVPLKK